MIRIFIALLATASVARAFTESPAGTFNTNGTSSDVQAAMNAAVDAGDTVVLPSGTFVWTSGVSWDAPANATLKGAGSLTTTGGGDATRIQDNIAGGSPLIRFTTPATGVARIAGLTIQSGTGAGFKDGGTVAVGGPSPMRIDHCHFIASADPNYKIVQIGLFGLMDHCILDLTGLHGLYFYNGRSGGGGDQAANFEWTQPTNFGSAEFFYIEDNIINAIPIGGGVYATRIYDGFTGAKVVTRFNTLDHSCIFELHATGHSLNDRGSRAQEAYGNLVTATAGTQPSFVGADLSNGVALVWGNSWNEVYKHIYQFNVTRKDNETYGQTATPNGWGYAGTAFNGVGSNWDGGTFNGTNPTLGYPCIDQPGRGPGDLIVGEVPNQRNNTSGTIKWPNQALEPIYLWNNFGAIMPGWGGVTVRDASGGRVVENRDYYMPASGVQTSPTSPFNGTVGVGWGTLANRPTTCTAGVAYFATDQGSWNTSTTNPYGVQQNGADGVLYKATATNTWTLYYTPYTYPHPLQGAVTDTTPPTPNPMTFASAPSALDSTSVTMTATTATDATSPPVEYLFDETSGHAGGQDSSWQSSPTYVNSGLSASTLYTYRVKARDAVGNETTLSSAASATTPAAPTLGTMTVDQVNTTNLVVP